MCEKFVTLQGHKSASAGWCTGSALQNKAPLWPAGPPFSWKPNRGLSLWKMAFTGRQLCVLAMLVHKAHMSPFHLFPKVPFSIIHQPGKSLGFSVIKAACVCIYRLVYSWDLKQVQDRDREEALSSCKNTTSLPCCIVSLGVFMQSKQVIGIALWAMESGGPCSNLSSISF